MKGYIGPDVLGAGKPAAIRYLLDPRVVDGTRWVTGANEPGRHVVGLVAGRDFTADGTIEAAEVRGGDACPNCGAPLEIARGIEIGHIFQLGRKYAEALGLTVLDQNGKQVTVTMGSYGIGVSRAVAAIAEATCDDLGLCWPREIAPPMSTWWSRQGWRRHLGVRRADGRGPRRRAGRVLFDDRTGVSPGVKFKDAELLGVPTIVVVGRGLADGTVEVKDRRSGERTDVPLRDVVAHLIALARS